MLRIYTLLLFLSINLVNAQKKQKVHTVKLETENVSELQGFKIDSIIDKRIVKTNIGFAQKGITNKRVAAVLPEQFEVYLKEKINTLISNNSSSDYPVTIIIHEFNVSEETKAMSETGTFRLQFEFTRRKEDKLYSLWYTEIVIEGKGLDVTGKHDDRIIEGLTEALLEFQATDWKNKEGELIENDISTELNFNQAIKKGLYASFHKLAMNEPFAVSNYTLKKFGGKKYPKFSIIDSLGEKIRKRVMFISDGEHLYLNATRYSYDSHFVKSKLLGRYVYFEDRYADPVAGIAFGLIGTAASNTGKGIILDTKTGLVSRLDQNGTKVFLDAYPEVKKEYLSSKKKLADLEEAIRKINKKLDNKI